MKSLNDLLFSFQFGLLTVSIKTIKGLLAEHSLHSVILTVLITDLV